MATAVTAPPTAERKNQRGRFRAPLALALAAAGLHIARIGFLLSDRQWHLPVLHNRSLITQDNDFVGTANYAQLLADPPFWNAWWHTIWFTIASTRT